MEYVDGPSLADVLATGPVAPAVALDVVAQAADGLAAAHRAGVVHRDVKPGNILIGPGGQVKVTDFGIAHAAGQAPVTGPGLVMGTAQYMAPERIAGGQGTPASDLYALGIVLQECLTGVPPFEGTSADVMAAHLYLPPPSLPAGVPAEVDALVGRLTVKDPARRISDAGELATLVAGLRDALAAPGRAFGIAEGDVVSPGPGGQLGAARVPPGAGAAGQDTGFVSAEWVVPSRMSLPTGTGVIPLDDRTRRRRRRGGTIAVGLALVTGAALGGLLISGAWHPDPYANPARAPSTSARATTPSARPSPGTGSASASGGAGGASQAGHTGTSAAAVPGTTRPRATASSTKASPSRSPSSSPSTSPSGGPSGHPTPLPSPSGSSCIAGICF
jgi:serine/threonine-protein kinase